MRCTLHVGASALKWGLAPHVSEQLLADCHLCVRSCRSSSEPLHEAIPEMVQVHARHECSGESLASRVRLWTSLGVPPNLCEWVAAVDPRWHPVRKVLVVQCAFAQQADRMRVEQVIGFLMRWQNWSDTRWLALGSSSRLMVASILAGVECLISVVNRKGRNNERYCLLEPQVSTTSPSHLYSKSKAS